MKKRVIGGAVALIALAVVAVVMDPGLGARFGLKAAGSAPPAAGGADARQPRATPVVTAEAETSDFPIRRTGVGFLSSPTVVNINARLSSAVTEVAVKDGETVKGGDLLLKLDDRALQAALAKDQAALAKDQAGQTSAEADLARAKELLGKGSGTQQAYDQQFATSKGLEAAVLSDKAAIDADEVQLGFATITAPVGGRLGAVNTTVGDIVSASTGQGSQTATPLVTITQMNPLQVTFDLPETDLPLLQKEMAAPRPDAVALTLQGQGEVVARGALDFIDSSVDTATGTIEARASIANPDGTLWPGAYVQATVTFGSLKDAVSIPTVAVQEGQQGAYVYVVGDGDKVAKRAITVALADGDRSAIASGLKAGEKVVVEGQGRLKDGTLVREQKPDGGKPAGGKSDGGKSDGGKSGDPAGGDAKTTEAPPQGSAPAATSDAAPTGDGGGTHRHAGKPVAKTASLTGGAS